MTYTAGFSPTGLIRDALSKKSDRALSALETRTCHSWKMALDRSQILPDTADLAGGPPMNLFIRQASGARITDIDGNAFIDLSMGCGAQILGHDHPSVRDAVLAQAAKGWNFDLPGADQIELARLIQAASPANERVVLCNSPGDASAAALAAARIFTGKKRIAAARDRAALANDNEPLASDDTLGLAYGDPGAFSRIHAARNEIAAVMVEPVRASDPTLEHVGWLRELAALCQSDGILLIFDELFSGFRLAFGGAQELLGIMPDLTIYGRSVGGGLPLAALAGRADVMKVFSRHRDNIHDPAFTGNPMSVAGGVATLSALHAARATIYPRLNEAGRGLADTFNAFCAAEHFPVHIRAVGSMLRIVFGDGAATQGHAETAFYLFALSRSVFVHASRNVFLSAAHRPADLDYVASALTESLRDVRDDGLFAVSAKLSGVA
jgi:glutamate-1-semialdehyde aminotransferase